MCSEPKRDPVSSVVLGMSEYVSRYVSPSSISFLDASHTSSTTSLNLFPLQKNYVEPTCPFSH